MSEGDWVEYTQYELYVPEIAKGVSTVEAPDNAVQFFEGRLFGKIRAKQISVGVKRPDEGIDRAC